MEKKKFRPLSQRVAAVCAISFVLLSIILSVVSYRLITTAMYQRYQEQMTSILDYAESFIDHEDMTRCVDTYVESERYQQTQEAFDRIIDHYTGLHYLYAMRATEPGDPINLRSICSANSTYEKTYAQEDVIHLGDGGEDWYSDEVAQTFRAIQEGNEDVFLEERSEWGLDYTLARPMINAEGKHYGVLCVDISIDSIRNTINRNVSISIALIIGLGFLFTVLSVLWMRAQVTEPLRRLKESVEKFVATSHGKRDSDELQFDPPDIRVNNEVSALSRSVSMMADDMKDYVQSLSKAEQTVKELRGSVSGNES